MITERYQAKKGMSKEEIIAKLKKQLPKTATISIVEIGDSMQVTIVNGKDRVVMTINTVC